LRRRKARPAHGLDRGLALDLGIPAVVRADEHMAGREYNRGVPDLGLTLK